MTTFSTAEELLEKGKTATITCVTHLDVNGRQSDISGKKTVRIRVGFDDGTVMHITHREYERLMKEHR